MSNIDGENLERLMLMDVIPAALKKSDKIKDACYFYSVSVDGKFSYAFKGDMQGLIANVVFDMLDKNMHKEVEQLVYRIDSAISQQEGMQSVINQAKNITNDDRD